MLKKAWLKNPRKRSLCQLVIHLFVLRNYIYISTCTSVTRWRFGHYLIDFSYEIDELENSFFRWMIVLCLLHSLWKYEMVWMSHKDITVKIPSVTRWRKRDKKLRVIWLFFSARRIYPIFKTMLHKGFIANSLRYPTRVARSKIQNSENFFSKSEIVRNFFWKIRNKSERAILCMLSEF